MTSRRVAQRNSLSSTPRTMPPRSSGALPLRVRRSFASRRSLSNMSSKSATPASSGSAPSATQAHRASSTRWKSGEAQRAPPPAS
eukprot:568083-Pleurochrysis_carterae.AAC.1